jgi:hypothetical protein
MDFLVLAMMMALSVGLSAVAARIVLEFVLQALWRSVEQPRAQRLVADGARSVLAAQLSAVSAE